jgi:YggT family protein
MATLIAVLLQAFSLLILARVLISWVRLDPYHPIVQFIYNATEPFLKPVREALPPMMGFDFSPMVVLILAQILGSVLISALSN